jgi:hypothetical protein
MPEAKEASSTLLDGGEEESDVEALPNPKNFASATQRWTLVHGVSRKSLKKIIAAKPKEEESQPVLDWYDDKHYEAVLNSHEEHPDLAKPGVGNNFPANGHGGFAKRHKPKPNAPNPCPEDLKFMFARLSPEQVDKLWNMFSAFYVFQAFWVAMFPIVFYRVFPWKYAVGIWGATWVYLMIQNLYFLHDCVHISPFPPKPWQKFITHTWADFTNVCWEDLVLEHSRHHAGTPDLLVHGEFGWDPAETLYKMQDYSWKTVPFVPFYHFLGINDTGILFMCYWYYYFPYDDAIEACLKPAGQADVKRIHLRRLVHIGYSCCLWFYVWCLGKIFMDGHGWTLVFVVNFFGRLGWALGWTGFANVNHSLFWNKMLANGIDRMSPFWHAVCCVILGGAARANEFKFHDLHHAFPNKVGALSMRGRFNGADKVYDGAMRILEHGIFEHLAPKCDGSIGMGATKADTRADAQHPDKESTINQLQRRRSQMYKQEKASGKLTSQRKSFVHKIAGGGELAKPLLA